MTVKYDNFFETGLNEALVEMKKDIKNRDMVLRPGLNFSFGFTEFLDLNGTVSPIMRATVDGCCIDCGLNMGEYIMDRNNISYLSQTDETIKSFIPDHIDPSLYDNELFYKPVYIMSKYDLTCLVTIEMCDELIRLLSHPYKHFPTIFSIADPGDPFDPQCSPWEIFRIVYNFKHDKYFLIYDAEDSVRDDENDIVYTSACIEYTDGVSKGCIDWVSNLKKHLKKYGKE